ncbi:MAG: hypothetical protein ABSH09_21360 [Bryobacteraceae bacterium]|jgi:hypothetical protein
MTGTQLYIAIGLPTIAVLTSLVIGLVQISGIREDMRGMRGDVNQDLHAMRADMNQDLHGLRADINVKFEALNQRFDDMRDLWRAELHRVEEVLDARLKHMEER